MARQVQIAAGAKREVFSARFYCLDENDGFTVEDPVFVEFGPDIMQRRISYREFLRNFDSEEEESFRNLEEPQGNKEFMRRLIEEDDRLMPKRRGRPIERIVA